MRAVAIALVMLVACGGAAKKSTTSAAERPTIKTTADRILPLFPDGAQVVVEVDLARLRANPVVGAVVTSILTGEGDIRLPDAMNLPDTGPVSPLATADTMVLASYGVGTSNAAVVIILQTKAKIANAVPLGGGFVALGPPAWTAQVEARAAIAGLTALPDEVVAPEPPARESVQTEADREAARTDAERAAAANPAPALVAAKELRDLRDHAMPTKAPGASLRITARLPFDARVALARATGLDAPPAQLSIWGDVVDDMVIIVDLDASDPGDRGGKKTANATKRMEAAMRGVLAGLAAQPPIQLLGLAPSLEGAQIVSRGTWVRAIIAVGPKRLGRVVERAKAFLATPPPAEAIPPNPDAS